VSVIHIALFTTGYPYVDAVLRATELSRRHGAELSRAVGEPFSLRRDQFAIRFLESNATHALLLEGDVVPPADALERLLEVDAPVATAVYPQWVNEHLVTSVQSLSDSAWSASVPASVFPVRRCLLGCVLVQREVFSTVAAPWFLSTISGSRFIADDEWFCTAVRRAGLRILCDGRVTCGSIRQGTDLLPLMAERVHK
jgi:hypothetical protein